jgi:hypothetical protein
MTPDAATQGAIGDDAALVIRRGSVVRHYGTEAVAWSEIRPEPVLLDPVAAVVVQLLDGEATVRELVEDVHAALGVDTDLARAQIMRVLSLLDGAGLLETSAPVESTSTDLDLFHYPPNT